MNRKKNDANYRNNLRKAAKAAGMSFKAYRASRWESVGWTYAVETVRKRCKRRGIECTITPAIVKNLWDKQNGICPITGWKMELRKSGIGLVPTTVTIDRIDQSVGYTQNNIRLICFTANNARHTGSDEDLLKFCKAVVNHARSV